MCPPHYFDVVYELETNSWMDTDNPPDKALAELQWARLYSRCLEFAKLELAPAAPGLPDMTFVANAGLPYKNIFICSNFYHEERRPEVEAHLDFFKKRFFEENIWVLGSRAYFEGQGDAVWLSDNRLLIGCGIRTNINGMREVETILRKYQPKVEVVALEMAFQKQFYHLDTCLLWLPVVRTFLIYEPAFEPSAIRKLETMGHILRVTEEEAKEFVCNSVVIDEETIFMPWVNDRLRKLLVRDGYGNIITFPMSEFKKSGGAVKCLLLEHDYPIS